MAGSSARGGYSQADTIEPAEEGLRERGGGGAQRDDVREGQGDPAGWDAEEKDKRRRERRGQQWKHLAASVAERLMKLNPQALTIAAIASLSALLVGYSLGISSSALLYFERTSSVATPAKEYFLATLNLGAAWGALMAGWVADIIGRRSSMIMMSAFALGGAVIGAAASSPSALFLSQVTTGFGLGLGLVACPLYITEIAPPSHRGMFLSLAELASCGGLALSFLVTLWCGNNWRRMLGLAAVPATTLGLSCLLLIPESPRWLALIGRVRDTAQALVQIEEREEVAAAALDEILASTGQGLEVPQFMMRGEGGSSGDTGGSPKATSSRGGKSSPLPGWLAKSARSWRELVLSPAEPVLALLIMSLGALFYQQASGMDVTVTYLPELFSVCGLSSATAVFAASLAVAASRAISAVISGAVVDELGRRPLILISAIGCTFALLFQAVVFQVLSWGQTLEDDTEEALSSYAHPQRAGAAIIAIIATCNSAAFYSLGLGPTAPLAQAESVPLRLRAAATGLATALNRILVTVLVFSLVRLADATSVGVPFFVFAAITGASVIFYYLSIQDFTGKSLEEAVQSSGVGGGAAAPGAVSLSNSSDWGSGISRRSRQSSMETLAPL